MLKYGWITLLSSEEYLQPLLNLKNNFNKVKTEYPLIVAVTQDLLKSDIIKQIKENNIIIQPIQKLNYTNTVQEQFKNSTILNTASKLNIFNCRGWDKLIYIDLDVLILKNIDELFKYPDGAMVSNGEDPPWGLSSLFVFTPYTHRTNFYITIIQNCNCLDGDLLGNLWAFAFQHPDFQIPHSYCHLPREFNQESKVIHFLGNKKPWHKSYIWENEYLKKLYFNLIKK